LACFALLSIETTQYIFVICYLTLHSSRDKIHIMTTMYDIGDDLLINDTQLMKGILEGCILSMAEQSDIYGYKAVEILNDHGFNVNAAPVYPFLTRHDTNGYLDVENRPSPLGPIRKYYLLTRAGHAYYMAFKKTWSQMTKIVNRILSGSGG
jgi:PadR family transcriptional regulator, regulatory protein PadR